MVVSQRNNHPMQPQSPKHQAGVRKMGMLPKSYYDVRAAAPPMTLKQELEVRERITEKLEKRSERVAAERQARRLTRLRKENSDGVPHAAIESS